MNTTASYQIRWSIQMNSMQDQNLGIIFVGSVRGRWSPWDEEINLPIPDQYLLLGKYYHSTKNFTYSWNILISVWRLEYSNSCQLLLGQSFSKKNIRSHLRTVMGTSRLQEHNLFLLFIVIWHRIDSIRFGISLIHTPSDSL